MFVSLTVAGLFVSLISIERYFLKYLFTTDLKSLKKDKPNSSHF